MMGLPRSGKSTIVSMLQKQLGAPIVRRDAIRLAIHGQRYMSCAEPLVKTFSLYMIKALVLAGHNLIICDETNYSKLARKGLQSPEWDIVYYPVLTKAEVCKDRAVATGQADLIPVIDEMQARYEPLGSDDKLFWNWIEGPGAPQIDYIHHPDTGDRMLVEI